MTTATTATATTAVPTTDVNAAEAKADASMAALPDYGTVPMIGKTSIQSLLDRCYQHLEDPDTTPIISQLLRAGIITPTEEDAIWDLPKDSINWEYSDWHSVRFMLAQLAICLIEDPCQPNGNGTGHPLAKVRARMETRNKQRREARAAKSLKAS